MYLRTLYRYLAPILYSESVGRSIDRQDTCRSSSPLVPSSTMPAGESEMKLVTIRDRNAKKIPGVSIRGVRPTRLLKHIYVPT